QHLAGQPVDAVDLHRVRTTHTVCAGAAEGERAVQVVLDVEQQVQYPVGALGGNIVAFPVRLFVEFRIEAQDPQSHGDRVGGTLLRRVLPALGLGVCCDGHQYFRSIGS